MKSTSGKMAIVINGFGLAAQFFFNQPLDELRVVQQAMLVV